MWPWPERGPCWSLWETTLSSTRTPPGQSQADLRRTHRSTSEKKHRWRLLHPWAFCAFRFIKYCVTENGCKGIDIKDAEGEDEVVSRLANLKICSNAESQCIYDTPFWIRLEGFNTRASKLCASPRRSWARGEHPPSIWGPRMEKRAIRSFRGENKSVTLRCVKEKNQKFRSFSLNIKNLWTFIFNCYLGKCSHTWLFFTLSRCLVLRVFVMGVIFCRFSLLLNHNIPQIYPFLNICHFWNSQKEKKHKTDCLSCLKNILVTLFMFTSDQTFITTLSVYKALLQWAFVEIWTQFQIVPETEKKKSYNIEQKLFPKMCACSFCRRRNETLFFLCMHSN